MNFSHDLHREVQTILRREIHANRFMVRA
jgi:hypothetical protein